MVISKQDAIYEAIAAGKTNDEIRNDIDGRLGDKLLNTLRANPFVSAPAETGKKPADDDLSEAARSILDAGPRMKSAKDTKKLRRVAVSIEGECMQYRVDADGIWLGRAENMLFVPRELTDTLLDELAQVRDEHEDIFNSNR